jgi:hypothetical protein
VCWLTRAHQHGHAQCNHSAARISGMCLARCAYPRCAYASLPHVRRSLGSEAGERGRSLEACQPAGCKPAGCKPAGDRAPANFGFARAAQVIDDVASMGFSRHEVRGVVTELMDSGQSIDLNIVLDRLMNGRR